jgi:MFS transporter, DHA1 family, multidrug resistance protein
VLAAGSMPSFVRRPESVDLIALPMPRFSASGLGYTFPMPVAHAAPLLPQGVGNRTLVGLIGCCLMLQPISTDLYLASLPGLARTFDASFATVGLTLSLWVAAFGSMQLVGGPLSDRYGRRPVLIAGLALYVASSICCALAPSIAVLIAARCAQAVGCCAVVVVARALVRDVYDHASGTRALAQASTIVAIGPIVGPILGAFLEVRFGFRGAFVTQTLAAAALLAAIVRLLGETNRHRAPAATRPSMLVANYASVLRAREFRAYTLVGSASYGGLFAFISGSSFVLIRVFGVPTAWFGIAFAFTVCGYLAGTILCRYRLSRMSVQRTLRAGASLALAAGLSMAGLAAAGVHHWAAVIGPGFVYFLSHGINFPCAQAGSVAPFPRQAGAASGLFGCIVMAVAALTGTWIGASYNGTVYPLAFTVAAFALLLFATVSLWVPRLHAKPLTLDAAGTDTGQDSV